MGGQAIFLGSLGDPPSLPTLAETPVPNFSLNWQFDFLDQISP